MKRFAYFVSIIFNPIFLAFLLPFFLIFRFTNSGLYSLKWLLFSSIFIFLGGFFIIFERVKGNFSDIDVSIREQRPKLYAFLLFLAFIYLIISLVLKGYTFPISIVSFGLVLAVIVFASVNRFIKASGHVGVACAFVLTIGLLYGFFSALLIVWIIPLLAWSRLVLKKHTILEIAVGGILGTSVTLATFYISIYLL